MEIKFKNFNLSAVITFTSLLGALYGHLNGLLPIISGGTYVSVAFIVLSSAILIISLYKVVNNPLIKRHSPILNAEVEKRRYGKTEIWVSKIAILLIIVSAALGIKFNIKGINKKNINFITETAKISLDSVNINFNIANNTNTKILITSFGLIPYRERTTCSYLAHDRYGLELFPDSLNDGIALELESGDFAPFTARIKYIAYSCEFKAFGVYLIYNDLEGNVFYKKSDAIYFINVDTYGSSRMPKIEYLRPGRFELLLGSKEIKPTTYNPIVSKIYYNAAIEIYKEHVNKKLD